VPRDRFGREIDYLRISVIDHCNLRCVYCMPLRGLSFVPSPELLTAAEIEAVVEAAVEVGCAPTSSRSPPASLPSTEGPISR
jgi:cyclic pyranopterin phosphate synthase